MSFDKIDLQLTSGLSPGCDLWVILKDSHTWHQEIDFRTNFQLSSLDKKRKMGFVKSKSIQVEKIAHDIQFPLPQTQVNSPFIYLQVANNLKTKWLCIIDHISDLDHPSFKENLKTLKCNKLRFFAPIAATPGLKASFPDSEFISEP